MSTVIIVAIVGAVGSAVGASLVALFNWLSGRGKTRVDEHAEIRTAWSEWRTENNKRLDAMNIELGEAKGRLTRVEEDLAIEKRRSWAAIEYIRVLRAWIGTRYPEEEIPEVPDTLKNDV